MGEPTAMQFDRRLLAAGYVAPAVGYGVLLIGVLRPTFAWLAAYDRIDPVVTAAWVLGLAMLGLVLINSGTRLRRAYRAGMRARL